MCVVQYLCLIDLTAQALEYKGHKPSAKVTRDQGVARLATSPKSIAISVKVKGQGPLSGAKVTRWKDHSLLYYEKRTCVDWTLVGLPFQVRVSERRE